MPLSAIFDEVKNLNELPNSYGDEYVVEGLRLQLTFQDRHIANFARKNLAPINLQDGSTVTTEWQVSCRCDPALVSAGLAQIDREKLPSVSIPIRRMNILRYVVDDDKDICVRGSQSVFWAVDRASKSVHMVTSARTQYPLLTARNLARDMIVSHLHDSGWTTFHAGLVQLAGRNYLILGDGGQGKTSLILALIAGGGKFVANERVLLKRKAAKVQAVSFPMSVAIGLGTLQNFQSLTDLCRRTDQLLLPQRRLDTKELKSTVESKWKLRKDKMLLLPDELCDALKTQFHVGEVSIDGILIPELREGGEFRYAAIGGNDLAKLLRRNVIRSEKESHYPDWMPIRTNTGESRSDPDEAVDEICTELEKLSAAKVQFFGLDEANL